MNSAGRILIMPKGEWNAETEYAMLDLVTHEGTAWIGKKNSVAIAPSRIGEGAECWQELIRLDEYVDARIEAKLTEYMSQTSN